MIIHLGFVMLCIIVGMVWNNRVMPDTADVRRYPPGQNGYKTELTPWLIVFAVLVILAALRTTFNDSGAYRESFEHLDASWGGLKNRIDGGGEWAFDGLGIVFKMLITDNYHAWFGFFAFLQAALLIHVLRKESVSPFYTLYYFSCSVLYINFFTMMRQWMAVIIVMNGFGFLKRKKFIPYLILCIIAAHFHRSAYFMIPAYFVFTSEPWSKRQLGVGLVAVIGFYYSDSILNRLISSTDRETYEYVFNSMSKGAGLSPVRILVLLAPLVLAYMYKESFTRTEEKILINAVFVQLLITVLASFTSGLYIGRFATYLNVYLMLLYPLLFRRIDQARDGNATLIKRMFIILYMAYYFYYMYHFNAWTYSSDIIGTFY